jgi:uncharacterized protein (DUF924 family)
LRYEDSTNNPPEVTHLQAFFIYMPLMHAEELGIQVAGVKAFQLWMNRCQKAVDESEEGAETALQISKRSFPMAVGHMRTIEVFGRMPARNEAIGRESTEAEKEFLASHEGGLYEE